MTRLVIFDMDGTLIDSQAHIVGAFSAAFEAVELPLPERNKLLSVVGLSLPYAFSALLPENSSASKEIMRDAFRAHVDDMSLDQAAPLYDGARAAIEQLSLRGDVKLAVATGASRRGMTKALEANGITSFFTSMHCADDHPSKPNPAMAFDCIEECGSSIEQAIVVGDTTYDMEMARAARCASIGVLWGNHGREALMASGAQTVIETFEQLEGALNTIWEK